MAGGRALGAAALTGLPALPGRAARGLHRRPLPGARAPHRSLPGKAEPRQESPRRLSARPIPGAARSQLLSRPARLAYTLANCREVKGERGCVSGLRKGAGRW